MNECKHRWVEVDWGAKHRKVGQFMYHCTRCHQCRFAMLVGSAAQ